MKNLFIAAFAIIVLVSCKEELGPEYTTLPVFSNLKQVDTPITAADKGRISATVSSEYGLETVVILYYLNDKNIGSEIKSAKVSFNISPEATTQNIEGLIPAQKAGTKVTYQFFALTPYKVQGMSAMASYTVEDTIVPLPDPEE